MTFLPGLTRRNALLLAAGGAVAWPSKDAWADSHGLDFNDPAERARILAAVRGSAGEETVYSFFRLHIYAYHHQGNLEPMMTMTNLNVSKWQPLANGNYGIEVYESGAYTKFDSPELLHSWTNPVTGEEREVLPFLAGPLKGELGPNGPVPREGAEPDTELLNVEVFGDTVMVPTMTTRAYPNPYQPDEWPKESSGPMFYWDSHYVTFASLTDLADRSKPNVRAHIQFQNLVSWQPWYAMGQRPGRTWGRAFGTKIDSLDQIPPAYLRNLEEQTPEILDVDSWEGPRDEMEEYKEENSPS